MGSSTKTQRAAAASLRATDSLTQYLVVLRPAPSSNGLTESRRISAGSAVDVPVAARGLVAEEDQRAMTAFAAQMASRAHRVGWSQVTAQHKHPQLTSEPED